jgi:hypothetical protein
MTPDYLITLARWGVNAAFWPAVAFMAFAWTVWPFWKSQWGLNIILLELAIALALISSVLSVDFGLHIADNVVLAWVEIVSLFLVGAIITWRGFLIMSSQLTGAFGTGVFGSLRRLRLRSTLADKTRSRLDKRRVRDNDPV